MREADYQQNLVTEIYRSFQNYIGAQPLHDIIVYVTDPNYLQGIADLMVFYRPTGKFAMLEVKLSAKSKEQPNQRWYIEHWGQTIFAAFIYPENQEEVLLALRQALAG
jgi:hypothetical protein